MTPETTQMLHDRAAQCERLAASAKLPEVRENLLDAASCWRALAYDDEELLALRRHRAASAVRSRRHAQAAAGPAWGAREPGWVD
jgi:hypothetical protein